VALLKDLDAYYPRGDPARDSDNHSAHIPKKPAPIWQRGPTGCSMCIPKHGSWLNLVETLLARWPAPSCATIRVLQSGAQERILLGSRNSRRPVVHRWKKFDLLVA